MPEPMVIYCAACHEVAAEIDLHRGTRERRTSLVQRGFLGETTIFGDEGDLAEFLDRISKGQLRGRDASEAEFLGFFCRACGSSYCKDCWTDIVTEFDEGFYDYTKATCPKGHEQIVDD